MHLQNAALGAAGDQFDPEGILAPIQDSRNLIDATKASGVLSGVDEDEAAAYMAVLEHMPKALDAAMLAAIRDALQRGLRVQVVWQESAGYELRAWESSAPSGQQGRLAGVLTLHLLSPEPPERGAA
jgi:hypothetical protein